ncbi:MAG: hypothetical protein ACR2QW_01320 [bacterium]
MPKYQENFKLNTRDIQLIEDILRQHVAQNLKIQNETEVAQQEDSPERVKQIHNLLGKLHNQKSFYSLVNTTGYPVG